MQLLTLARRLRQRKAREEEGLFVAEGLRAAEELLGSSVEVRGVLVGAQLRADPRAADLLALAARRSVVVEDVDAREFESAASTESPQGVLAVAVVPANSLSNLGPPAIGPLRLLVLDGVQDPGNVGTMLRTAAAFGVAATIALPGTVDLWNAKVVRSGMGAHYHHLCLSGTWDELDTFRRTHAVSLWAADGAGEPLDATVAPERLALVVGNEGGGLSSMTRTRADRTVALPLSSAVESLNVAVATGILLYELRR
ncbi:MAG TPA: RNA methyltransferase [Gemmatimonadaceae bacterium]|nr:RNA methyltransferase [Gemmatimonadaceae bacterium]